MARYTWIAVTLALALGCSRGAGSGKLEPIKSGSATVPSNVATRPPLPTPEEREEPDAPKPAIAMAVAFPPGKSETYILTNDISILTQVDDQQFAEKSFLTAKQDVKVIVSAQGGPNVSIHTYEVKAGVPGQDDAQMAANDYVQKTAALIEGSLLHGRFDAQGRGTDLFFIGEGIGLNPLGPQAGSQKALVGFMGVLLPKKPAKPGDTWKGTFDFTQSGMDLFERQGGRVENGELPITYTLLDYDTENNAIRIGLRSTGNPVVNVPLQGAMATIKMAVSAKGEALVRMDDGWLQEMRIETNVTTEGLVASKQTIKSITRRQK